MDSYRELVDLIENLPKPTYYLFLDKYGQEFTDDSIIGRALKLEIDKLSICSITGLRGQCLYYTNKKEFFEVVCDGSKKFQIIIIEESDKNV
jgi:hypothetical protein